MWANTAGAFTAVFKLADQSVHARELIPERDYEDIQDRWAKSGNQLRWSEAFLIIEAWEVAAWPKARDILVLEAAKRTCETESKIPRRLNADDQAKLAHLELMPIDLPADGLAAKHFIINAQRDNRTNGIQAENLTLEDRSLFEDFQAIEGSTRETRLKLAQRDRHLVKILKRNDALLKCAICLYDPMVRGATVKQARAILEAHHKTPIHAGKRLSRLKDMALLCPTCHREVHQGVLTIPNP